MVVGLPSTAFILLSLRACSGRGSTADWQTCCVGVVCSSWSPRQFSLHFEILSHQLETTAAMLVWKIRTDHIRHMLQILHKLPVTHSIQNQPDIDMVNRALKIHYLFQNIKFQLSASVPSPGTSPLYVCDFFQPYNKARQLRLCLAGKNCNFFIFL